MSLTDFILPVWVKPLVVGLLIASLFGGGLYLGLRVGKTNFLEYQRTQQQKAAEQIKMWQGVVNGTVKNYNRKVKDINLKLDVALTSLHNRPVRAEPADTRVNCTGGTGAELSREDAGFLTREAARADTLREGLAACYEVIDGLRNE